MVQGTGQVGPMIGCASIILLISITTATRMLLIKFSLLYFISLWYL